MAHIQDKRGPGRPKGWVARWTDPDGKECAKAFARKLDAENHLTSIEHDKLDGSYIDPDKGRTTVEAYYRVWNARQPWRESTRSSIESLYDRHILPAFGRRGLGSIRRGDIETWAAGLGVNRVIDGVDIRPLAGQTARLAMQKFGALLEDAVEDGYIAKNPARNAKKPLADVAPVVPFTADELDRLSAASADWFRVALVLGSAIGLRQGEATGLTIDRVDFLRRTLTVDRQLVTPNAGDPAFGPPKTKRSYRTIPLADVALDGIARHVEAFGTGRDDLVLHEDGRPVRRQRFGQVWRQLRRRADLPRARFHDTRHTYAAVLLSGGVGVPAAADYLGHTPGTLLSTYAHLIPADYDRARDVVQAAFANADGLSDGTRTGQEAVAPAV